MPQVPSVDLKKTSPSSAPAPKKVEAPRTLAWWQRSIFGLSGTLLIVGFFLPWVIAGTALELSGLGLVFSGGDVVQAISGSGRVLLFLVPVLGAILVAGAVTGHRLTPWIGTFGAGALLLFGAIQVITIFISSTGLGMWLVVFSSLLVLLVGALSVGGGRSKAP